MAGRSRTCTALRPAEVVASGPALTGPISWAGTSDGAMARAGGTRHLDRLLAGPRLRACGEVPGGLPCADAAAPGRRPGPHRVQEHVASGPVAGVAARRHHHGRMPAVPGRPGGERPETGRGPG